MQVGLSITLGYVYATCSKASTWTFQGVVLKVCFYLRIGEWFHEGYRYILQLQLVKHFISKRGKWWTAEKNSYLEQSSWTNQIFQFQEIFHASPACVRLLEAFPRLTSSTLCQPL